MKGVDGSVKIGIAQLEIVSGDRSGNLERIHGVCGEAATKGADLLCLPEMCTTGFDWESNRRVVENGENPFPQLQQVAMDSALAICGSILEPLSGKLGSNSLFFIEKDGSLLGTYRKMHLFSVFKEDEHLEKGAEPQVIRSELGSFGCAICYDLRFPELFRANLRLGAEFMLLPSAFPHPRLEHWRVLNRARAIENQCYMIATNQCGPETSSTGKNPIRYFGHSMVVDPLGEVVFEADEAAGLSIVEIDRGKVDRARERFPALRDRREDVTW